jgi:hypothetical protein
MAERHSILSLTRILKGEKEYIRCASEGNNDTEIPFTKEAIDKLAPFFTDNTKFLVRGGKLDRRYGVPQCEWVELDHDSLIDYGIYGRRRDNIATSKV